MGHVHHGRRAPVSGWSVLISWTNTPEHLSASVWRSMPSKSSAAACAARQESTADAVEPSAQPMSSASGPSTARPEIVGERLGSGDDEAVRPAAVERSTRAVVLERGAVRSQHRARGPEGVPAEAHRGVAMLGAALSSKPMNCRSVSSKAESGMLLTKAISSVEPSVSARGRRATSAQDLLDALAGRRGRPAAGSSATGRNG